MRRGESLKYSLEVQKNLLDLNKNRNIKIESHLEHGTILLSEEIQRRNSMSQYHNVSRKNTNMNKSKYTEMSIKWHERTREQTWIVLLKRQKNG